jgi:hypothetical protein
MSASDSQLAAGRRLAGDLRAIRRKHGIDLKEVLDATRLADDVIEALEEDALVNHPAFNRVYLRSLFGAYGDAIGIQRNDMVTALEEVFEGNYVGSLARNYLGRVVEEDDMEAILSASGASNATESIDPPGGLEEEIASSDDSTADAEEPSDPEQPEEEAESKAVHEPESGDESESVLDPESGDESESGGQSGEAVAAAEMGDESGAGNEEEFDDESGDRKTIRPDAEQTAAGENVWTGLADKKTVLLPNMSGTALMIIAGIAFVTLLWFAVSTVMNLRSDDEPVVVAPDTTVVDDVFRPERVLLPDSMEISVIAFTERLDPIRITADRDLRKPYWVELMDTHRVVVTERILLEREADHTRVLVDGYAVPQRWLMEGDPAEISRDRVQAWLDSLVAAGTAPRREPLALPVPNEVTPGETVSGETTPGELQ